MAEPGDQQKPVLLSPQRLCDSAFHLLLFHTRLPAVVHVYSELGHLGTWVGTKRVGLPDPRLGVEQAWLCHHHGAHLRRLEEEKHHCVSGRY